jgi:hypothetical protein
MALGSTHTLNRNEYQLTYAVFAWYEDAIDTSASCLLNSLLSPAIHADLL